MLITKTTPAVFYDSFTVEIHTRVASSSGEGESNIIVGPFKRVSHMSNLENLLHLLKAVEKEDFYERYTSLGFVQWFAPYMFEKGELNIDDPQELEQLLRDYGYFCDLDDEEELKAFKDAFILSEGFRVEWPIDPRSQDGYQQALDGYKVFYYDPDGFRYNTEIQL